MSWRPIDPTTPRDRGFFATNGVLVGIGEFRSANGEEWFYAKAVYAFDQSIEPHTFGEMIGFKPTHWQPIEQP